MLETLRKFLFRHEEGQPESSAILAYARQGVNKGWDVLRAVVRSFPWGGILRGKLSWGERWFLWAVTWGGLVFVALPSPLYLTISMVWLLFFSCIFLLAMRKSWWRILLIPVIFSPIIFFRVIIGDGYEAREAYLQEEAVLEAGLQIEESLVAINPDYKKRSEDNLRLKKVENNLCELKLLFLIWIVHKKSKCFGASITLEDYENPIIRKIAYDVLRDPCPYYKAMGDKGRDLNKNYKAAVKKLEEKIAYNKKFGYPIYRDVDDTPPSGSRYLNVERQGSWDFLCDQPAGKRNAPMDRYLKIITPEGGEKIVRILHIAPDGEMSIDYFAEVLYHSMRISRLITAFLSTYL